MKRLQFRHNNEVFQNRTDALKYFADIVDTTKTASTIFQSSLYAEPLVAKYLDEDGNQQVILAIGVDSGLTPYHIIDSKEIAEGLDTNKEAIESEVKRAKAAEMALSGSIETEIARAIEAERILSGAVDTERDERIAADAVLQTQLTENIAKIVPVTENLGANVREEYALKNAKGEELGSHIKVYKDSALVGAEINYKGATAVSQKEDGTFEFTYGADMDREAEYLYLIYRNENGGLSLVALDFENFLMESEEGFGIKIVEHKIAINIKDNEKYLKVSENGLQTINIDEAIKDATDKLNAKLDEEINRSKSADEYISGVTNEFSASTVAEFISVNSALTVETERALAAELHLSGAINTEREERIKKDEDILTEIGAIKEFNTGLDKKIDVEITRSTKEDANFKTQMEHLALDLTNEISNRESANTSIRAEFAAGDAALGNRIAAEELARQTAYNALNTRIDNEATTRESVVATLTTEITNGDKAVRESYEAADAVLQGAIQAETKNRETADSTLSDAISNEVTTRSTEIQRVDASIASLLSSVSGETQDRKNEDAIINGKLVALSGNVLTEINKTKTEAINESFGKSSAYTDTEIAKAIQGINNKKVNDVSYDNGNKKIYLTFADGTVSAGFDASEFVVDGMLNEVKFDENTNEITFKWNTTAGITDVIVPLNKFVDQYRVSTDSASYLKISENNEISAIVDDGDGFSNTLATTTFVTTSVNGAYNKINVVSGSVETINNSVKELSGSVKSSIGKIAILNADKKTEGSVLYKIDNEFEKSLITDGVPVTAVSPEDANKVHSLIRQITVNGEMRYYAMSDATEMFYVKPRASESAPIEAVNLNDYITSLETRIAILEERLSGFEGNIEQTMKNLIKSYLVGTENEIKIAEADNKLKIGFDDNAIFGEI